MSARNSESVSDIYLIIYLLQRCSDKDIPRWQKLTKEDFVDTILSDTDDEVDQVEQTVAMSGFNSQSIPDEKFYCIVCHLFRIIFKLR